MPTPDWINYDERDYGASDPNGNADVYNRPNIDLWENFTAQHDKDGVHKADLDDNLWKVEEGTYTGNGADNRNISLSASIDIKFIRVWSEVVAYTFTVSEDMSADDTRSEDLTVSFTADQIQSVSTTGQFQVGTHNAVNQNSATYFYVCYGV